MEKSKFTDFYQSNVKRVYKFLFFRVGGNKEVAEDLTQDVFLKALQAFESYDPKISQTSWILTIARNHLINQLEKTRPSVNLEDVENILPDCTDALERMACRADEKHLVEAIKQLPKDDATLVQLKYLEGWQYEEMAVILGKTAGTLRVQAHRALKCLRKALKHI
ncbi:sigma-70 family RNA polymerase sigma factor [Candidatus Uhrbacteria bacterium]|nr:sigma-70 family RNA polymerase sigma factor [Candidatus Uhrbacteria bacterium]